MDAVLTFNANDKVRLASYFSQDRVEQIAFADGTSWNYATVASKAVYNGTANADSLFGLSGVANRINGLGGNDSLYGASLNDILEGGAGNDYLQGYARNDIFRFANANQGMDSIADFTSGMDTIEVAGSQFGLTAGAGVTLVTGTAMPAAVGTTAQFLYNSTSGALYFDQDGAGAAYAAMQIATLTGQKTLVASDIAVVDMWA